MRTGAGKVSAVANVGARSEDEPDEAADTEENGEEIGAEAVENTETIAPATEE